MKYLLLLLLASCSSTLFQNKQIKDQPPIVILISIDGYRYDYTNIYKPSFLSRLPQMGVSSELKPIFPSYTFPNHYSIVTGLYAENHGIINNSFYDPIKDNEYSLRNRKEINNAAWYDGEPLWVTAEKQGMITACHYWVGCEAKIKGYPPTYNLVYNQKKSNLERVQTVLNWLRKDKAERPRFITLYFSDVDFNGHKYGPLSPELAAAIKDVDQAISFLVSRSKKLYKNLNFVIVSDHGMEDLRKKTPIYLDDYVKKELMKFQIIGKGPIVQIYNRFNGNEKKLYQKLKKQNKYFSTYTKDNIPSHYHYKNNNRAPNILLVAKNKYLIQRSQNERHFLANRKASHGYDPNNMKSMRGIFYAFGPLFKKSYKFSAFENIHIQPLLVDILDLKNHKVDGKLSVLKKILVEKNKPLK